MFGTVVVATVAWWAHTTRDVWFYADEWDMARQLGGPRTLLRPYNGHLSILILGLYRALLAGFGFSTHVPYRLAGLLSFAAVGVAMFLTTRRRLGATLAAALGLLLLWPRGITLEAGGLNHSLALVGAIVCASGLRRTGRRADAWVLCGLTFALCATGAGLAVAVAALLHSACSRAGVRRWAVVVLPLVAWATWWVVTAPSDPQALSAMRPGPVGLVADAAGHAARSFAELALGNQVLGGVLVVAFSLYAAARLRQGLGAAANVVAWSGALAFWWIGLGWARPFAMDAFRFRYELLSVGFVLLAVQPPGEHEPRAPTAALPTWTTFAAPVAVLLLAGALAWAVHPDVEAFGRANGAAGLSGRAQVDALGLHVVPGPTTFGLGLGGLDARQLRQVVTRFGAPPGYGDAEAVVREAATLRVLRTGRQGRPASCLRIDESRSFPAGAALVLYSAGGTGAVGVRRFGSPWVRVGAIDPGRRASLVLPALAAPGAWDVRGEGACVATI